MHRSHGPLAFARARASATLAASYTSAAPIARSLVTMDSRSSGWSSTTSAVKRSAVAAGVRSGAVCSAVTSAPFVPSVVTSASPGGVRGIPPTSISRGRRPERAPPRPRGSGGVPGNTATGSVARHPPVPPRRSGVSRNALPRAGSRSLLRRAPGVPGCPPAPTTPRVQPLARRWRSRKWPYPHDSVPCGVLTTLLPSGYSARYRSGSDTRSADLGKVIRSTVHSFGLVGLEESSCVSVSSER